MENFIRKARGKAIRAVCAVRGRTQTLSLRDFCTRAKSAVQNREGQGTLDVAITVLISIVLGALILGGLYLLVDSTVLPTITQKIQEMFNYKG